MCILKRLQGQCKPNAQKTMDIASVLACSKLLRRSLFSQRFLKKRCKGSHFCAYGKINCTKSAKLCTLWLICAIFYALNDSIHIY